MFKQEYHITVLTSFQVVATSDAEAIRLCKKRLSKQLQHKGIDSFEFDIEESIPLTTEQD